MMSIGIAIAVVATFAAAEPIHPERWLSAADYDDMAIPTAIEDNVRVAVTVGKNGEVIRCTPVLVGNSNAVGLRVCGLLRRRARFRPAQDIDGTPLGSVWTGAIRLTMPGTAGRPPPARFDRVTTVNRLPAGAAFPLTEIAQIYGLDGKAEACRVTKPSGFPKLDALACADANEPPAALLDSTNRPMRAVVTQTVLFVAEAERR